MHKEASGHKDTMQDLGHQVATGGRASVPGSPSPSIFAYKIRAREKVRKGEGEPGDEAIRYPTPQQTLCEHIYMYSAFPNPSPPCWSMVAFKRVILSSILKSARLKICADFTGLGVAAKFFSREISSCNAEEVGRARGWSRFSRNANLIIAHHI